MIKFTDSKKRKTILITTFALLILLIFILIISISVSNKRSEYIINKDMPSDISSVAFVEDLVVVNERGTGNIFAYSKQGEKLWEKDIDNIVINMFTVDNYIVLSLQNRFLLFIDNQGLVLKEYDLGYSVKNIVYNKSLGKLFISSSIQRSQNYIFVFEDIFSLSDIVDYTYVLSTQIYPVGIGINAENGRYYFAGYNGNLYECQREGQTSAGKESKVISTNYILESFVINSYNDFVFGSDNGYISIYDNTYNIKFETRNNSTPYTVYANNLDNIIAIGVNGNIISVNTKTLKTAVMKSFSSYTNGELSLHNNLALVKGNNLEIISVDKIATIGFWQTIKPIGIILVILFFIITLMVFLSSLQTIGDKVLFVFKNTLHSIVKMKKCYIMLLPLFAFLIVFVYFPVIWGFSIAFQDYMPGVRADFVGFDNFIKVFQNNYFISSVKNMFIFLFTDLLKAIIMPVIVAESIICIKSKKSQYWARVLMYIPGILPGVATMLIWTHGIYSSGGILNQIFGALGVNSLANLDFLGNGNSALASLIFIGFPWVGSYIIVYGALMSVPDSLYEAAKLDGCSRLKIVTKIDLPMIFPQLKYLFIMAFIGSIQDFSRVYLTTGGGPGQATYIPALELFYNINTFKNYGVAAAMGILLFIVIFSATLIMLNVRKTRDEAVV